MLNRRGWEESGDVQVLEMKRGEEWGTLDRMMYRWMNIRWLGLELAIRFHLVLEAEEKERCIQEPRLKGDGTRTFWVQYPNNTSPSFLSWLEWSREVNILDYPSPPPPLSQAYLALVARKEQAVLGRFQHGLCSCFDIFCRGLWWNSGLCICIPLAQLWNRLKLSACCGRANGTNAKSHTFATVVVMVILTFFLLNLTSYFASRIYVAAAFLYLVVLALAIWLSGSSLY